MPKMKEIQKVQKLSREQESAAGRGGGSSSGGTSGIRTGTKT